MGVLRLFSRGGQGGRGRGQKHTICLKSTKKDTIFLEKIKKDTILHGQGGKEPSPTDAQDSVYQRFGQA